MTRRRASQITCLLAVAAIGSFTAAILTRGRIADVFSLWGASMVLAVFVGIGVLTINESDR